MGETTKIEWCDATWNPWEGCQKVIDAPTVAGDRQQLHDPACDNCYADARAHRFGYSDAGKKGFRLWGPPSTTQRLARSEANWRLLQKWNDEARAEGKRRRVFIASLADVFEANDNPIVTAGRERLFPLCESTPWLDKLLLTKRPENVRRMVPAAWLTNWPAHVWVGTTVANQEWANIRVPLLLQIPAKVRFLSVEPMLGPIILRGMLSDCYMQCSGGPCDSCRTQTNCIDWVICGGESGPKARPMHPEWARALRDQCAAAGVPFFFKQWGNHVPVGWVHSESTGVLVRLDGYVCASRAELDVADNFEMRRVGKHAAGNLLDGRLHQAWPEVQP